VVWEFSQATMWRLGGAWAHPGTFFPFCLRKMGSARDASAAFLNLGGVGQPDMGRIPAMAKPEGLQARWRLLDTGPQTRRHDLVPCAAGLGLWTRAATARQGRVSMRALELCLDQALFLKIAAKSLDRAFATCWIWCAKLSDADAAAT